MNKILMLLLLVFFFCANASAVVVPITVKESDSGVSRTGEYIVRGIPLAINSGVTSTTAMKISTDEAGSNTVEAQFHVISRWDTDGNDADAGDPIRVVLAVWKTAVSANSSATYYLHTSGGSGTAAGTNIASDETGYHKLDTGSLEVRLKEAAGFNFFDQITVDAVNLVSAPASDGIILRSGGVDYTSYNSNVAPTIEIIYNGPLMACVSVEGILHDSSNNPLIPTNGVNGVTYKVFYWAFKDERTVRPTVVIKNQNNGYSAGVSYTAQANVDLDYLYIRTTLAGLGTPTAVRFGAGVVSGTAYVDDTSPSGVYKVAQEHPAWNADSTTQNDFSAMSYLVGPSGSETTNNADRFDSYSQIRDANRGLMVANRWFWQNYWKDIQIDATNKRVDYYLWSDKSFNHPFIGGIWKSHELLYNFHGNIASDYTFSEELAALKKRVRGYTGTEFTSNYFYRVADSGVTSDVYYNSDTGESVQAAIDYYDKALVSRFDGSVSDSATYDTDFDELRETRPYTWGYGIYNGNFMNWYGWLNFGDGMRSGLFGPGAQNYDWVWMATVAGNRNRTNYYLELADQFARHYGDILIIHNPTSDTTTASSSGTVRADIHGGQRAEWDGLGHGGNFAYSTLGGNEPGDVAHMWASGYLWQYLLYGDPLVLDVAEHIADHVVFRVSGITRHATQYIASRKCDVGPCYTGTPETRMYSRAIAMLVDLWKIEGDYTYLDLAGDVFTNGVLNNEADCGSGPAGFMDFNSVTLGDSWVGYDAYLTLDSIQLWHGLNDAGETTVKSSVLSFLTRQGEWVRDGLYTTWTNGTGGDYSGATYFPYQVPQGYFCATGNKQDSSDDGSYSQAFTQGFAFLYERTGQQSWMDLARNAWRDGFAYIGYHDDHDYVSIVNSDPLPLFGNASSPGDAWLKYAKQMRHAMYYLAVESGVASPGTLGEFIFAGSWQ